MNWVSTVKSISKFMMPTLQCKIKIIQGFKGNTKMKYLSWYCTIVHIKLLDNILSKLETIKSKLYHL